MVAKRPPGSTPTRDAEKAAQLQKVLDDKKVEQKKKKILDPLRDPKSYSEEEMLAMIESGEVKPTFTDENIIKFAAGEITWAQLSGISLQDAYSFAEVAFKLFEQGKYDKAQAIVEGLVIANPYDAYFHSLLGSIYGRKNMLEEALEEYSTTLSLNDKDTPAYVNRAEILLQKGDIEKALQDLKHAVELDPKGETPFGIRARALAHATASALEEAMRNKGMDPKKLAATAKKHPAKTTAKTPPQKK